MKKNYIIVLITSFLLIVDCFAGDAVDDWKTPLIKQLNGGSIIVQDQDGKIILSHHADKAMVPASILKIATADAVMTHLGKDYQIPTEFYLTEDNYLAIKGFGDPTLVSESLSMLAKQIKKQLSIHSYGEIKGFWLDTSFFKPHLRVDGQFDSKNPYDSSVGALLANFNTIYIYKSRNGKITSAEPQTPLTPTALKLAKKLSAGKHRINLGQNNELALRYFSELLSSFLKQEGIEVPVNIINQPIPENSKKLFVHHSLPVAEIIEKLFSFSNNLIANQLLIILGGTLKGTPADLIKGREVLTEFLVNTIGLNHFVLEEGSGLSRKNQFSARQIMSILMHFKPYQNLLRIDQKRFQAKTGTLNGISTYAGYLLLSFGDNYPFVIMLNKAKSSSDREKIANMLYQGISRSL
ncbi:MAG: D-alanyl-D-alanine carboxypeptidase [gamma proteobacterium symbiont of Taylorina sp.]|nr:D-alanyl-D-alanine carboxypeptidase [gamma proteobacterium symbiont of Taylorina sp.]